MHASIAILISVASIASAAPTASGLNARFSSNEVIYLSHCVPGIPEDVGYLEADYYGEIANSHSGQQPDSISQPIRATYPNVPTLEGQTQKFQFNSPVSFNSHIVSNGGNLAVGAYAGDGDQLVNHSFNKKFECYKDNGNQLYAVSDGFGHVKECQKLYFCRPN